MSETHPIPICFISLRAYPLLNPACDQYFGGSEVDLYLLATELARDDRFDVHFIVGDYGQPEKESRQNITIWKSLDVRKNLFLGGWRIWRAMRQANCTVYLSKGLSLGTFLYALFCAKKNRAFVFRAANSGECDGTYIRKNPWRGRAVLWALRQARARLVQNQTDGENLQRSTGLDSLVIRNGTRIPPPVSAPRNTVLWVGRSDPVKGPHRFLDLAKQFPAQHFTMICQKSPEGVEYESLTAEAAKISNLTFLPRVSYSEVDGYFQQAKVFVNTSVSEGFPNTFIQACQHGAAILSWKVNPDGFLDQHGCGFCARGDWQRFYDSLRILLESGNGESYGLRGRQYAQEHHDIAKIIEPYKELFVRLAGKIETQRAGKE